MNQISTVTTMTLDGGVSCLDFVNSGYDREKDVVAERLHTYDDLLILSARLELFDGRTVARLKAAAKNEPDTAEKALQSAKEIREMLYQLLIGHGRNISSKSDLEILDQANHLFIQALQFRVLRRDNGGIKFVLRLENAGLYAPVWKLVLSAYDLLNSGSLHLIKQCGRCAWLFLDQTKSHRKKWCSMESCGNSQKTKRYYLKKKNEQRTPNA
ncbi:CGNR zinc finger domain-containing protein [Mucilaginibacter jinjuensis]|uniref:CGNR zinc finger domain-containing protein n=1 Tax=Mucilaginibacter jinjuensis TaxID=1176721 RepID=A0ABY7TAT8_9SPHI|nr:CGNR zinc finger domain-containing protein [Mucilaginibacter jinjuensis]WCT13451.1 CGNR zinc finger domain-containing protein [Mucilaginibacter jinjuensis]